MEVELSRGRCVGDGTRPCVLYSTPYSVRHKLDSVALGFADDILTVDFLRNQPKSAYTESPKQTRKSERAALLSLFRGESEMSVSFGLEG